MIEDPDRYLEVFAKSGADGITVHAEACKHLHRTVHAIKALGKRAGVAINPATPLVAIEDVIADMDVLLLMSVNPGFGGQAFIHHSLDKLRRCRQMIDASGSRTDLEVDGGVDAANAAAIVRAGARTLVAGNAVYGHPDGLERGIAEIRAAAASAVTI
jgi:ribulose-phosphate 3-epimerase